MYHKGFLFSKHAKEQLKRRSIEKSMVDTVLNKPDSIIKHSDINTIYQKVIKEERCNYPYRVFVNESRDPKLIITVYKTSKIEKYEN
jgi:hypothetical protein